LQLYKPIAPLQSAAAAAAAAALLPVMTFVLWSAAKHISPELSLEATQSSHPWLWVVSCMCGINAVACKILA